MFIQVAILCYGDLVQEFGDELLPHVDGKGAPPKPAESALAQLLLKSVSKEKKFVLEASQKVLDSCANTLDPAEMSHKLIGYLKHKYALCMIIQVNGIVEIASACYMVVVVVRHANGHVVQKPECKRSCLWRVVLHSTKTSTRSQASGEACSQWPVTGSSWPAE